MTIEELKNLLKKVVANNTEDGMTNWGQVKKDMKDLGHDKHKEAWRTQYRYYFKNSFKKANKRTKRKYYDKERSMFGLEERLLDLIKTKRSVEYVTYMLACDEEDVLVGATRLQLRGYNVKVWEEEGKIMLENIRRLPTSNNTFENLYEGEEFTIAIVGDTHLGHKCEALDELKHFYEYAYSKGVRYFYHVGDLTDGYYKNRDNSIFEQHKIGFQQQLEHVVDNYPQIDGVTTYFITGNHDLTHTINGGANIGDVVGKIRKDMIYLGHNFAKVWLTPDVDINLIHPTDGSNAAISYKAQKIIDAASGKRKSKIMAIGHYHKVNWVYYKNIHAFNVPSFQHQTDFMASNNLVSVVGGFILTIKVDHDGKLLSVIPEFVNLE